MSCCPPDASCIQCPIIVSCVENLVLAPGQLQFCPASCKFYYDCAGSKTCLNPTYGLGLRMTENCILQVGLAPSRPLIFDDAGNIDIDCAKLVTCCNLVTQSQFASAITILNNSLVTTVNTVISGLPKLKKCGGEDVTPADTIFTVGDLLRGNDIPLTCEDRIVTWGDLLKCSNAGVAVPLVFGDILAVLAGCTVPVGSPPAVGGPPAVSSPPVGAPPVGSGCCDLTNSGPKNYSESYSGGALTGSVAPVWAFSYNCAANGYIPFAVQVVAGSLPPGLSVNGVDPNSDGSGNYYFQGFSGSVVVPAVTTTYTFTIKAAPFDINSSCYSLAEITYTISVAAGSPPAVGAPPVGGEG